MTRLPSLNALRAFEAAARHLSLTKAARELHVTPAAVSHQIKGLEADLGVVLLLRAKGRFVPTRSASAALPLLRGGFDQLAEAARLLRADRLRHLLTVGTSTTFASTWLVRRLGHFRDACPDVDVRLDTTDKLTDFAREDVDLAIRFGRGDYPGLEAIKLFDNEIFPVCGPGLLERGPPLETPDDLAHHTLLHVDWRWMGDEIQDWEMWLQAAGVAGVDLTRGPRFSNASLALQAAIEGQGVALASASSANDDLAAGRLVRLSDIVLSGNFANYLVYPKANAELPKIKAFREWILAEARVARQPSA